MQLRGSEFKYFKIPRRDLSEPPRAPLWLRTLSDPPPHLPDEDWDLIEHIRQTGQIGSGCIQRVHEFNCEPEGPPPLDANAPERLEALQNIAAREASARDFFNSPEQKARRLQLREQRVRDRAEMEAEWRKQDAEWQQQKREREVRQREQDREWLEFTPEMVRKREKERKRIAAEQERERLKAEQERIKAEQIAAEQLHRAFLAQELLRERLKAEQQAERERLKAEWAEWAERGKRTTEQQREQAAERERKWAEQERKRMMSDAERNELYDRETAAWREQYDREVERRERYAREVAAQQRVAQGMAPPPWRGDPFMEAKNTRAGHALSWGGRYYIKEEDVPRLRPDQRAFLKEESRRDGVICFAPG
jgi:hypothetical protein